VRRQLVVIILSGLICLLGATSILAAKYNEAPMLRVKVAAGELPPVEKRLPEDPLVVKPVEEIGQYGGTLRVITTSPRWDDITHLRAEPIFLLSMDAKTTQLNIAKSYEFSKDRKILTLHLRKGIKWSDGAPFTVEDVLFALQDVALNKDLVPTAWGQWRPSGELMKVKKLDDYTVRLSFAVSYPIILDLLSSECPGSQVPWLGGSFYLPKHYLKKFHIKYNPEVNELAKKEGYESWQSLFKSKLGFYTDPDCPCLSAWKPIKKTTTERIYERNPYYWKVDPEGNQLPYIDKLSVAVVQSLEVVNLKTISGEADFAGFFLTLDNYTLYKENEKKSNYRVFTWEYPLGSAVMFEINQNNKDPVLRELIQNVKLRQALSLAINREEINELIFLGLGEPRQATVTPDCSFYKKEWGEYYADYNPAKANKLLDEMGLNKRDKAGYRLRPDGKVLSLTVEYPPSAAGVPSMGSTLELVKEYWEKIGIKVFLKQEDRSLWSERISAAEHDVSVWCLDRATEFGVRKGPGRFYPSSLSSFAPLWSKWLATNGEAGEEPPEEVKKLKELIDKWQLAMPGTKEYKQLAEEIFSIFGKNLWIIGTVGLIPQPIVVNNNLGNIPEKSLWACDYDFNKISQGPTWFFKK